MAEYHKRITIFYCHKAQQKYGTIVSKNSSSIHRFWLLGSKSLKNVLNWKRLLVCLNANRDLQRLLNRKTIRFLVLLKRTALSAAADRTTGGCQGSVYKLWETGIKNNQSMVELIRASHEKHHHVLQIKSNFIYTSFYIIFIHQFWRKMFLFLFLEHSDGDLNHIRSNCSIVLKIQTSNFLTQRIYFCDSIGPSDHVFKGY